MNFSRFDSFIHLGDTAITSPFRPQLFALCFAIILAGCAGSKPAAPLDDVQLGNRIGQFVGSGGLLSLGFSRFARLDSISTETGTLQIFMNDDFANAAIRPPVVAATNQVFSELTGWPASQIEVVSRGSALAELVPNLYREPESIDSQRYPLNSPRRPDAIPAPPYSRSRVSLVTNLDQPWIGHSLLGGRHIALWPSHGWYYEPSLDRWEWQRARLFESVEDKLPLAFTLQYLVPMLEGAGASVYLPRERDTQSNEIVVDNDDVGSDAIRDSLQSQYAELSYDLPITSGMPGFRSPTVPLVDGDNPFMDGSYRILPSADSTRSSVQWIPAIRESGSYAVYVSYANPIRDGYDCAENAAYTVNHAGGQTQFVVNQCISFGTWVYLGHFEFDAGEDAARGSVTLVNDGSSGRTRVTADAVRFGGGMGSVARGGSVSGRPRYLEAARYYLQYAGIPDSLVYDVWGSGDYIDDYRSRGEWVNYLVGAPFGPNVSRSAPGLNVPIDVSLAFHTDAGMAQSDTTIGTLLIYSTTGTDGDKVFPDGVDRRTNRDLADIMQTEIVSDMRRIADREWPRRPLWDRDYSEAVRPNVPSALLELLAHQNFTDMQFALDPRFRFAISRSIYKSIARYLAFQYGTEFVAQPLPVTHFSAVLNGSTVNLSWQAQADSLEPSAKPDSYVVYRRVDDGGWDNGTPVRGTSIQLSAPDAGRIYSYKVRALNRGGLGFPSEVLSVGRAANSNGEVLVVNGFDRVAGPQWFDEGRIAGFPDWLDHGVADRVDISRTGPQYRFQKTVPWSDDDAPGFGASAASVETEITYGNSFDFVVEHGRSIVAAGYSFSSVSDESFGAHDRNWSNYAVVDLLLGEEKLTPWPKGVSPPQFDAFPAAVRSRLESFSLSGGGLFVNGAYVGSELSRDSASVAFASRVLGFALRTDHAVRSGETIATADLFEGIDVRFSSVGEGRPYTVEAPDAVLPSTGSETVLRFAENNMGAAVARSGARPVIVTSIPFETIVGRANRDAAMKAILQFLTSANR